MASLPLEPLLSELPPALRPHHHTRSNYHDPNKKPFAGVAGYTSTRHYYGATTAAADGQPLDDGVGDLAAAPYANYEPKAVSALSSTATGFVPTSTLQSYNNRLQSEYDARHQGKIDFVINTANYELDANEEQPDYQSYSYQPRALVSPLRDYHIEQFSNYRHPAVGREQERVALHQRQVSDGSTFALGGSRLRAEFDLPVKRQQQEPTQHYRAEPQPQQEDQQLLYSQAQGHIADLPDSGSTRNSLPPITTSVHHTASSSKAIAGLPLAKHIEVTKHVPITHYQKQHVPYMQPVQIRVPRPVIAAIPKPIPIKIPVSKTVAVPQLQEVKIPLEKVKPVAVERPIPFVVERRVPYRVEKPIATPIYYPYPVKVPIVRTVVHKQNPQYAIPTQGMGTYGEWNSANHLLG